MGTMRDNSMSVGCYLRIGEAASDGFFLVVPFANDANRFVFLLAVFRLKRGNHSRQPTYDNHPCGT